MDITFLGISCSHSPQHKLLLQRIYQEARKSTHPSTHNAALIVDGTSIVTVGVNTYPPGVKALPERIEGQNKHVYLNHAETDAVYKAARAGVRTEGMTMVMPWLPCIPCANAIISAGIRELIVHKQMIARTEETWHAELRAALTLLSEAQVRVIAYDGIIGIGAYMHKQHWTA